MNRVTITPTKFEDVRVKDGKPAFGFRAYDDEGQAYDNTWDSIPDDDLDFLAEVRNSDDETVVAMLDFCCEMEQGLYVGQEWYDWDKIRGILTQD